MICEREAEIAAFKPHFWTVDAGDKVGPSASPPGSSDGAAAGRQFTITTEAQAAEVLGSARVEHPAAGPR